MKHFYGVVLLLFQGVLTTAFALTTDDRILKSNFIVEYTKAPKDVDTFADMITKGEVYGRLRSHVFVWDWERELYPLTQDNSTWGLGGSITYKTALLNGFGATAGFYGTFNALEENTRPPSILNYAKAGKDTFRTRADGSETPIGVFAVGYSEYSTHDNNLKIGRQIIESTLVASNDGKMIPNTFEAALFETKLIPDSTLRAGYIMSQKLRDHQNFHSIIAFEKYNENDDNGAHKGLTPALIQKYGADVNPEMVMVTLENKSIPNLRLNGEYNAINGFFSTTIVEANYQLPLIDGWKITPGFRYLYQKDDGAGKIGGASLNGVFKDNYSLPDSKGYTNPNSADGSLWATRLVASRDFYSLMCGYSRVSNKADIIAPWRGFPTGGYTRAMAMVDWIANTRSWMIKGDIDLNKGKLISGMKLAANYEKMDYDYAKVMAKSTDLSDRTILHIDIIQEFASLPNTEFKFRFATINADPSSKTSPTLTRDYESYDEYRFEINYLF